MTTQPQQLTSDSDQKQQKEPQTGAGTFFAYAVEAKTYEHCPAVLYGDKVITNKWTQLDFVQHGDGGVGIPNMEYYNFADRSGFVSYAAAQALRFWFLSTQRYCFIETRIKRVKCKYEFSIQELEPIDYLVDGTREEGK